MTTPTPTFRLADRHPIGVAAAYTVTVMLPTVLVGAYAVRLQDDLDFGTAQLGYALSVMFASSTIAAAVVGPFIDRVGTSTGLRIGAMVSAGGSAAIALLAHSWLSLVVALVWLGLGVSLAQLSANRLLVRRTAGNRQGIGFGLKQAAVPSAALLAGLTVSALGSGVSWRATYLVVAGLGLIMAAAAPRSRRRVERPPAPTRIGARARAPLLRLALAGGAAAAAGNSLPLLTVDAFAHGGFSESAAALVLGVGSGLALAVRVGTGWLVDRRRSPGYTPLAVLLAAGALGFSVLAVASSHRILLVAGAMVAFAAGWGWNGVIYFAATRRPEVPPATATGIVLTGVGLGTTVGPLLIALIADHAGYGAGWATGALVIAAGAVLARTAGVHRQAAPRVQG